MNIRLRSVNSDCFDDGIFSDPALTYFHQPISMLLQVVSLLISMSCLYWNLKIPTLWKIKLDVANMS